jgi:Ca-activated chloride channel family protein
MISFAWPWVFALAPLPLLVWWLAPPAPARTQAALRLPFVGELLAAAAGRHPAIPRRHLLLGGAVWLLLVTAAARPQWLGEPVELPLAGRDLMLAVDVSGSMQQQDYMLNGRPVTRLDVVKALAGRFVEQRESDRLGLILFGSRAYLQTPLTRDRRTVRTMLEEAVIGLAGRETAIGDAIALGIKHLREQPQDNRVLIILTDGSNTAGNIAPLEAARLAATVDVRIYTIGIGGGTGGLRPPFGAPFATPPRPGTELDPVTLQAIATETGGRYFQATDTLELEQVYAELDRLEPSVRDSRTFRPIQPMFTWRAGAALLLSAAWVLSGTVPIRIRLSRAARAGDRVV